MSIKIKIGDIVSFNPGNLNRYLNVCSENERIYSIMKGKECVVSRVSTNNDNKVGINQITIDGKPHYIVFTEYEIERYLIVTRQASPDYAANMISGILMNALPGMMEFMNWEPDSDKQLVEQIRAAKKRREKLNAEILEIEQTLAAKKRELSDTKRDIEKLVNLVGE